MIRPRLRPRGYRIRAAQALLGPGPGDRRQFPALVCARFEQLPDPGARVRQMLLTRSRTPLDGPEEREAERWFADDPLRRCPV